MNNFNEFVAKAKSIDNMVSLLFSDARYVQSNPNTTLFQLELTDLSPLMHNTPYFSSLI